MGHCSGDGIVVLHVKRINHLFHCHQMIILPFFQKIHILGSDPFSCLTSSCQQHPSTPLHTPLHPATPVSTFYLKLSAEFKTTFLLLFPLLLQFSRFIFILPFALGALSAQDHIYFQFEGSWLHKEYKLEFQTSMRIDSWLKISEKAFFPTQSSSFLVWWADIFLATFLPSV